jgi:hypothetical protein
MTDIVERLRQDMSPTRDLKSTIRNRLHEEAADEIERLREKCDKQAMILRRLTPDKFPDTFFIHGHLGTKDQNGLPEKLLVVPAYGCDWSQIYVKTDKTTGPEW